MQGLCHLKTLEDIALWFSLNPFILEVKSSTYRIYCLRTGMPSNFLTKIGDMLVNFLAQRSIRGVSHIRWNLDSRVSHIRKR